MSSIMLSSLAPGTKIVKEIAPPQQSNLLLHRGNKLVVLFDAENRVQELKAPRDCAL